MVEALVGLIEAIFHLVALLIELLVHVVAGVCQWAFDRENKRKAEQRGFEVKRTAGPTPVLMKERDDDHG